MRLPFEMWLAEQRLNSESQDLFAEAILCHKAGAFNAAMLFSYLGFQTVVRDRILVAPAPTGIAPSLWARIQTDVRNDDKWDATVFDEIQRQAPASIFQVGDDVRNQVTYWKNRRNDCAHAKKNAIGQSHVESFWLFVQSGLPRIVVNGSRASLKSALEQHYNPSLTPPGQSPVHLVAQVHAAVSPHELHDFVSDVVLFAAELPKPLYLPYAKEAVDLFVALLRSAAGPVATAAATVFSQNDRLVAAVLRRDPGLAGAFVSFPSLVRKVWHDHLFVGRRRDLSTLCGMLSAGVIPTEQVNEALRHAIVNFSGEVPNLTHSHVLAQTPFYDLLAKYAFEEHAIDDFTWANGNVNVVVHLIDRSRVDDQTATSLHSVFNKANHPFDLREGLEAYFRGSLLKATEVKAVLERLSLAAPVYLRSLA